MKFYCQYCSRHLDADKELEGKSLKCPSCLKTITVPIEKQEGKIESIKRVINKFIDVCFIISFIILLILIPFVIYYGYSTRIETINCKKYTAYVQLLTKVVMERYHEKIKEYNRQMDRYNSGREIDPPQWTNSSDLFQNIKP